MRIITISDGTTYYSENAAGNAITRHKFALELQQLFIHGTPSKSEVAKLVRHISAIDACAGKPMTRKDFTGAKLVGDFQNQDFNWSVLTQADLTEADTTGAKIPVNRKGTLLSAKFNSAAPPVFILGEKSREDFIVDPETRHIATTSEIGKIDLKNIAYKAYRQGIYQTHTDETLRVPKGTPVESYFEKSPPHFIGAEVAHHTPADQSLEAIEQTLISVKDPQRHAKAAFLHALRHDPDNKQKEPTWEKQVHIASIALGRNIVVDHPAYEEAVRRRTVLEAAQEEVPIYAS